MNSHVLFVNKIARMCRVEEAEFLAFSNQYYNLSWVTFYYLSLLYYVRNNFI